MLEWLTVGYVGMAGCWVCWNGWLLGMLGWLAVGYVGMDQNSNQYSIIIATTNFPATISDYIETTTWNDVCLYGRYSDDDSCFSLSLSVWRAVMLRCCASMVQRSTSCTCMSRVFSLSSLPTLGNGLSLLGKTTSSMPGELLMVLVSFK